MNREHTIAIIAIIVGAVPVIVTILIQLQFFEVYPEFKVQIKSSNKNSTQTETVTIENIGRIQARNTHVFLMSEDRLILDSSVCFEGTFPNKESEGPFFSMDFEKVSTHIPCIISFTSSIDKSISQVIILSDNQPGYIFYPLKNPTKEGDNLVIAFATVDQVLVPVNQFVIVLVVSEAIAIPSAVIYVYYLRKKREKERLEREKELEEKIRKLDEEVSFYTRATLSTTALPEHVKERLSWLSRQKTELQRESDEIGAKLSTTGNVHELIGRFFSNWASLEQKLYDMAERNEVYTGGRLTLRQIVNSLEDKGILPEGFISDWKYLYDYRNQLAHGKRKGIESELTIMNDKLNDLTNRINGR